MLEIKQLSKVYKPKKGVPVNALNNVSLIFPETGMVFLLGKSGSGKSTLLNLLGGLDKYDGGEIVINGVSSKSFSQSQFDSYRNTCVGFIFQEYNVLEDFTVGANIALALELQGKRAEDEEINKILHEVDLDGYGARRPGELSGGQKQRVAIARALVKNPDIIMADEPTGALDSATGRQVLETLKKLSKHKLVIVVSHDREFAENYGDRIIELSDGQVVSDVERSEAADEDLGQCRGLEYAEDTVVVPCGYRLTEEDREEINRYIESMSQGKNTYIKVRKKAAGFVPTDTKKLKSAHPGTLELIKSHLPAKSAFKIGAGGLKHKKVRLVVTILLSCIAFGLFGLSDTFGAYNHITTCTNSLMDTGIDYISLSKSIYIGSEKNPFKINNGNKMSDEELAAVSEKFGVEVTGVYSPYSADLSFLNFDDEKLAGASKSQYNIYAGNFTGFCEIDETVIAKMGYRLLCGSFPDAAKNEMAISKYICETFRVGGYVNKDGKTEKINSYQDMIGKTLTVNQTDYTVTAIVDTNTDIDRYTVIMEDISGATNAEQLVYFALSNEFATMRNYSLASVAMVGKGKVEQMINESPSLALINNGWIYFIAEDEDTDLFVDASFFAPLDGVKKENIVWVGGEKTELADNEIIVSEDMLEDYGMELKDAAAIDLICDSGTYAGDDSVSEEGYKIVGCYKNTDNRAENLSRTVICTQKHIDRHTGGADGEWDFAVGAMPEDKAGIERAVRASYESGDDRVSYDMNNSVTYELDSVNTVLKALSGVFFWIGVGFALFAALMLANFIATSISYKKQEIGILRAIGSRGTDVFKIFFSESFIIAAINFVLSAVGVGIATATVNYIIRSKTGLLITVLHFGIRQILLLIIISLAIAALSSFFPVKRIASKRPIDAIRNR